MTFDMCFIGFGISTRGALKYFLKTETGKAFVSCATSLSEKDKTFLESVNVEWEEGSNSERCLDSERIVVSPGVPPSNPIIKEAQKRQINVMSDFDYIVPQLPHSIRRIGITGTNGKTTTVELAHHLLSMKYRSAAMGNIGTSPADIVLDQHFSGLEFAVFELSSFQLFYTHIPFLDIGALLNITTDHLSWHGSFETYRQAKTKIFTLGRNESQYHISISRIEDRGVAGVSHTVGYRDEDDCQIIENPPSIVIKGIGTIRMDGFPLKGKHNKENAAFASFIASLAGVPINSIVDGLRSFAASEHRLEEFLYCRGIRFINDSKSTNADSAVKAIKTFCSPKKRLLLLMGGRGKGEDYSILASEIIENCRKVYLCGENVPLLLPLLEDRIKYEQFESWERAIKKCLAEAQSGDTVLFSPGGSSFDFFSNYKERGEYFKNTCRSLSGM